MANNRLYIVVREPGEEPRQILLAKGFSSSWEIWEPATLVDRLRQLIPEGTDIGALTGSGQTVISIEDENHQEDNPQMVRVNRERNR